MAPTFLTIPPELRINIYECVLVSETPIRFEGVIKSQAETYWQDLDIVRDENRATLAMGTVFDGIGLIFTCRLIAEEAIPIIYSKNIFEFALPPLPLPVQYELPPNCAPLFESFRAWRENIGTELEKRLRSVKFILPNDEQFQDRALNQDVPVNVSQLVKFQWEVPMCSIEFQLHALPVRGGPPQFAAPPTIPVPFFDTVRMSFMLKNLRNKKEELAKYFRRGMLSGFFLGNNGRWGYLEYDLGRSLPRGGTNIWKQRFQIEGDSTPAARLSYLDIPPTLLDLPPHALRKVLSDVIGPPRIIKMQGREQDALYMHLASCIEDDQSGTPFPRAAQEEVPYPAPQDLLACQPFLKAATDIYNTTHKYVLHQKIPPNRRGIVRPGEWMLTYVEHVHTLYNCHIDQLQTIFDFEGVPEKHFGDIRLDLTNLHSVAQHVLRLSVTVRIRGVMFDKENTFSFNDVLDSEKVVLKRRSADVFLWPQLYHQHFVFAVDGYGDVRSIRTVNLDTYTSTALEWRERERLERVAMFPDEPTRRVSKAFSGWKVIARPSGIRKRVEHRLRIREPMYDGW